MTSLSWAFRRSAREALPRDYRCAEPRCGKEKTDQDRRPGCPEHGVPMRPVRRR